MQWILTFALMLITLGVVRHVTQGEIRWPPGVLMPGEPVQAALPAQPAFMHGAYRVQPLASFDVRARVLSVRRYTSDAAAGVSPLDFALGWNRMSDSAVLEHLHVSQYGRFAYFRQTSASLPINFDELITSSANVHLIPANDLVKRMLMRARRGQLVHLRGMLVRVEREDGWTQVSSLTRTDSGDGACELMYVHEVYLVQPSRD